jgi:predicted DNA-binding protein
MQPYAMQVILMQVTVRLTDIMSERLQILLDRGLTKTHIMHEALDRYLPVDADSLPVKVVAAPTQNKKAKSRKRR